MRLCIDARMYGLKHAGIGRYVENLIRNLRIKKEKYSLSLLVRREDMDMLRKESALLSQNIELIEVNARHYTVKEQLLVPFILYKHHFDLVHFPHFNVPVFYNGKFVVTIHDLLWHEMRGVEVTTLNGIQYFIKYAAYRLVFTNAVKRAVKVLTPSLWVRNKLINRYHINDNKVIVTYEGIDKTYLRPLPSKEYADGVIKSYGIKSPYVVYTGSVYPHKNIKVLIEAVCKINNKYQKTLYLYIASSRNVFTDRIQKVIDANNSKLIRLLGFVPDDHLQVIYWRAVCFAFPSLSEGFGLPGLEAMASSCPVLASNSSVLPEIYKNAALYFNPGSKEELIKGLLKLAWDKKLRSRLTSCGHKLVKEYNWKDTAERTVKIYESCLGL